MFSVTVALVVFGLVMIYSASAIFASQQYNNSWYFFQKQILWAVVGFAGLFILLKADYHFLQRYSRVLIIISFSLLVLVLTGVFGREVGGAKRWIRIGPISFQPSELAKISLLIYIADYLDRKQSKLSKMLKGVAPILIVMGLICGLILIEPDMGTSVSLGVVCLGMLFVGGLSAWYVGSLILMAIPLSIYLVMSKPYRLRRLMAFFDPWSDPQHGGYQIIQSLIALGSGGFLGVGLGNSKQKLLYLPAAHTDFIFPIIGEELGFIGALSIVALFFIFAWRGMKIAFQAPDLFGSMLAGGITFMIVLQAIINMGVACALFPTKGLSLPLVSYGGSNLAFTLAGIGILLNISRQTIK
ncbi:MAG: putative lipid II flippase FtsW [Elusimicrobia bacterium]|nr:putative lipid II flippase FtsW [Elusimicrobiota bacterium]